MLRYAVGLVPGCSSACSAPLLLAAKFKHSFLLLWMWTGEVINKENKKKEKENPPSWLTQSTDKHLGMLPAPLGARAVPDLAEDKLGNQFHLAHGRAWHSQLS